MNTFTRHTATSSVLVFLATLAVAVPLVAQSKAPGKTPEKKPVGNLEVTVAVKDGGVPQSVALYLRDRAIELGGGKTIHLFEEVLQARYTLAGDASVKTASGEVKRYAAIQPVSVNGGKTTKVTLTLEAAGSMEGFCSRCHPSAGQPSEPGQIIRDAHASGKALEAGHLKKISKYNAKADQLAKQGQPHNLPIPLEKRKVVEGGKTVERDFFTCESCHTLHWSRGERKYARAPFADKPDLCVACH